MSPRPELDPAVLASFKWSESIIADVLQRLYAERIAAGPTQERLLSLHLYFWKVLIFGSEPLSRRQRHTLIAAAYEAGFDSGFLSDFDAEVMNELLEIILRRYRATPLDARKFHLLLLSVSARLRVADLPDPADASRQKNLAVASAARSYR